MNTTPLFERQSDESEYKWQVRVRRYISKNAPKEYRYFIRDGKPGKKGQRWILPGFFILMGILLIVFIGSLDGEARDLNGPNGRQGDFMVESLVKRHTKNAEDPKYLPVVTVRNERIIPLFSQPNKNNYEVGQTVTLKYSQQGKVIAAFLDKDGTVTSPASSVGIVMGIIAIAIGVLVGKFYRGAVDPKYIDQEFARLTNQSDDLKITSSTKP